MLRTEFRILIPAIEYEGVGGLGNLASSHKCRIGGCHSGGRSHIWFFASGRSPDRGLWVMHRSWLVTNDFEDPEIMAVGDVGVWPNDISILGGIKLDGYVPSGENTGAVSTGICNRLIFTYENLVMITSRAALPS